MGESADQHFAKEPLSRPALRPVERALGARAACGGAPSQQRRRQRLWLRALPDVLDSSSAPALSSRAQPWAAGPGGEGVEGVEGVRTRGQRGRAGRARVGLPPAAAATRAVPASCPHRPAAHPRRGQDGCERREMPRSRECLHNGGSPRALSPAGQETVGVGRENSQSARRAAPAVRRGALGRALARRRSSSRTLPGAVERCRSRATDYTTAAAARS